MSNSALMHLAVTDEDRVVRSVSELFAALKEDSTQSISVHGRLRDVPSFTLPAGKRLHGAQSAMLHFADSNDGVQLTCDNVVSSLTLVTAPNRRAIWNSGSVRSFGTISLRSLQTIGRVQLLAHDQVQSGHIDIQSLDIVAADALEEESRPHAYGVSVLQGALTVWNMQPDADSVITVDIVEVSVGRIGQPVLGTGVFISGAGENGGQVRMQRLQTDAIFSDGRIPPGTANLISGGVFTLYDVHADLVKNNGPVTTYGLNDMALDNWGTVDRWIASKPITTFGQSGVGFVNFGQLNELRIDAPIETFGPGARGFNVYNGDVRLGFFDRIVTHGDGAVGVQISQPVGHLSFRRGIETFGGIGPSLVKGLVEQLPATALSIKAGGFADCITITGGLKTHHPGIPALEQLGCITTLHIENGFVVG